MKVYVTKYALTSGIEEVEVRESLASPGMVVDDENRKAYHGEGREWHRTFESARKKAEEMRMAKIFSLNKQIKKYEKMRF